MCLKAFKLNAYKFMDLIWFTFYWHPDLAWQAYLKKTKVDLELLLNVDILLMVEKGVKDGMCHAIHRYAKANNK